MKATRILGLLGAGVLAATLMSTGADARPHCVWPGNHWRCRDQGLSRGAWDSGYLHHNRTEAHHDRRRVHRLATELNRDIRSGSSTAEIRRDARKLDHAKRELREDRWGY
jgi:hypothetical protein